jgi:hypothetical protein
VFIAPVDGGARAVVDVRLVVTDCRPEADCVGSSESAANRVDQSVPLVVTSIVEGRIAAKSNIEVAIATVCQSRL